jgi:phosphatidate cytidylyltransferase
MAKKDSVMNNLLKRALSGIVFLIVMVFGLIWDRTFFGALFLVILYFSLHEFYTISLGGRFRLQQKLGLLTGSAAFMLVASHYFYGIDLRWLATVLIPLMLIPVTCLFRPSHEDFGDVATVYAGLLYIALPISLSPILVMDGEYFSGWLLLSFFILIWVSDICAYCFGTAFGQKPGAHKLAPEISPKKSWWGVFSGIFFCILAAAGLHFLGWLQFSLVHCLALGLIISIGCVFGDLVESLWKRYCKVKDSGSCIPGHGGMLDRFDSSLVAIPLASVYLALFNLL